MLRNLVRNVLLGNASLVMVGLALAVAPIAANARATPRKARRCSRRTAQPATAYRARAMARWDCAPEPKPRDFTKAEFKFDTDKDGKMGTDADSSTS